MTHQLAALIGGLQQAVEDPMVQISTDPQQLLDPSARDQATIQAVRALVSCNATPPAMAAMQQQQQQRATFSHPSNSRLVQIDLLTI